MPNDSDDEMDDKKTKGTKKSKKTFIKEAPEEIVDLADIKSIGNVLSEFFGSLRSFCRLLSFVCLSDCLPVTFRDELLYIFDQSEVFYIVIRRDLFNRRKQCVFGTTHITNYYSRNYRKITINKV